MKILYLADLRFPMERANGIQTIETAHALARGGAEVELVVRRSDERSDEACLAFFDLPPHPALRLNRVATPFGRWSYLLAALGRLLRERGRHRSLVYTRDLLVADLALRSSTVHRLPVFYEAHTVASVFAEERAVMYQTERRPTRAKLARLDARESRVCRLASGLVTITEGLREALAARHGGLAPSRVIRDGCRLPAEAAEIVPHPLPARVVYIGQLYPWKGVDVLVEAMRDLEDAELVVVGGLAPEPDLDRLKKLASDRSVSNRVRFQGFVPPTELPAERTKADVFVIPLFDSTTARLFTSPLKLFESMASRRPIVASDLPSIREVLTDDVNALLVPPGDPAALARAIRRLTDDSSLSRRLAAQAFQDVRAYAWDRRAERLIAFLRELTREGSAGSGSSDR
jgi:glycosyltransferase involved in cell wall biosynthesis